MYYATVVTLLLLIFSGQTVNSQESSSEPAPVMPIAIDQGYLEGRGLTRVDPSEFDGENVTRDDGFTSDSYTHAFYAGKIFVAVYEAGPGRVYIDGAVYDEFVQILEGRLILTPDGGDAIEFKQGESLVVPQGYKGYWYMPEKYRELIIINTDYAQTEGGP
jgi:uncharacterized cupin superfamily protein